MLDYFVATAISSEGAQFFTFCDATLTSAIHTAQRDLADENRTIFNVEYCEMPEVTLIEPVRTRIKDHVKTCDHMMLGGELELLFREERFLVSPTIFEEPIFYPEEDCEDGRTVVGSCQITHLTGESAQFTFELDEIDNSHGTDHLLGVFFAFAVQLNYFKGAVAKGNQP
jgi:hypothetical protein